jgi:hypothetical protein
MSAMKAGKLFPLASEYQFKFPHHVMAQSTGEYRHPRKGDWYLSGAIVEAYLSPANLSLQPYNIARLVRVTTSTRYHVTGLVDAS